MGIQIGWAVEGAYLYISQVTLEWVSVDVVWWRLRRAAMVAMGTAEWDCLNADRYDLGRSNIGGFRYRGA